MSQPFLYSVEREFPVPVESLWRAWTDASELEAWYHPTDLTSTKGATASDLTIGGLWSCGVDVPTHDFTAYFYGQYTKIIANELLEHTMHYTQSAEEFVDKDFTTPSHHIVIEFQDRGHSSWVKFSQYGELPEGEEKQAQAGMNSYLESLAQFLAE
jgi:uncharacterized protein YndB with AHSA1/START domain